MSSGVKNFFISFFTSLIISIIVFIVFYFYLVPLIEQRIKKIEVPNLIGTSLEESRLILGSKELLITLGEEKESNNIPKGKVAYQIPLEGAMVKKGAFVKVFISKGEGKIKIPDFSGISLEEAEVKLKELGLKMGKVEGVYSETVLPGRVVSTEPPYNSEVDRGTNLDFILSEGNEKVVVPNLLGKKLSFAQRVLEKRGLKIGKIKYTCDEEKMFDIILWQRPKQGERVDKKSAVSFTINSEATE